MKKKTFNAGAGSLKTDVIAHVRRKVAESLVSEGAGNIDGVALLKWLQDETARHNARVGGRGRR